MIIMCQHPKKYQTTVMWKEKVHSLPAQDSCKNSDINANNTLLELIVLPEHEAPTVQRFS